MKFVRLFLVIALCLFTGIAKADIYGPPGSASDIETNTTNFDNNLSTADTDVQKALDTLDAMVGGSFAPTTATYLTSTANGTLTNEVDLGALSSGFLYGTVAGGVSTISSIATAAVTNGATTLSTGDQIYDFVVGQGYLTSLTGALLATGATTGATSQAQAFTNGIIAGNNSPTGDYTLTQNSVVPFTSVFTGAVANTLYLKTGNVGIGTTSPSSALNVMGAGNFDYGYATGALRIGADLNASTISVNVRKVGRITMPSYDGGSTNTFLLGGNLESGVNDIYFGGITSGSQYAATGIHFFTGATQTTTGGTERLTINNSGNVGIGTTSPNQLLTVENSISLKEIASANADTAAYGQIWVKNTTPNQLWFTDDAGIDVQLGASGMVYPSGSGIAVVSSGSSWGTTLTAPSGTVVGTTDTQTLTNKRITKRVVTDGDAASITPNSDNADIEYQLNTQATGTLTIGVDTGTPTNGQAWLFKIKSTNVQTFSFTTGAKGFYGGSLPLPTASSGGSLIDYYAFIYDSVSGKWHYTGQSVGNPSS